MALYLVQHGKSLPKEADPDQGLSDEGSAETRMIAEVAAGYKIAVMEIRHSPKDRARQTAEIIAGALSPSRGIKQIDGIKPMDDVTVVAENLSSDSDIMLVGHLPFMARLTAYLVTGQIEPSIFRFQNSGIVCLDKQPDEDNWQIKWTLMPNIG